MGAELLTGLLLSLPAARTICTGSAREAVGRGNTSAGSLKELNAPSAERWRAKPLADARRAFGGVLRAEGFLAH